MAASSLEGWAKAVVVRNRRKSAVGRLLVMDLILGGKLLTPNPIPVVNPVIF
jgi:hypothetical protein